MFASIWMSTWGACWAPQRGPFPGPNLPALPPTPAQREAGQVRPRRETSAGDPTGQSSGIQQAGSPARSPPWAQPVCRGCGLCGSPGTPGAPRRAGFSPGSGHVPVTHRQTQRPGRLPVSCHPSCPLIARHPAVTDSPGPWSGCPPERTVSGSIHPPVCVGLHSFSRLNNIPSPGRTTWCLSSVNWGPLGRLHLGLRWVTPL